MSKSEAVARVYDALAPIARRMIFVSILAVSAFAGIAGYNVMQLQHERPEKRVKYYAIHPETKRVPVGTIAKFWSDMEVFSPVTLEWEERIECDYSPFDSVRHFSHYVNVEMTRHYFEKPISRSDFAKKQTSNGFVSNRRATGQPITYDYVGDCRLVTKICQLLDYGIQKCMHMRSEVVEVRSPH